MSVGRQLPGQIQKIFDQYKTDIGRRLTKEKAVELFINEFGLSESQASAMFKAFDKDGNGVMSIHEFRAFYFRIGDRGTEMMEMIEKMDKDKNGKLDAAEAKAGLMDLLTADGREVDESQLDFIIATSKGNDDVIDVQEFSGILIKLKLHQPGKK